MGADWLSAKVFGTTYEEVSVEGAAEMLSPTLQLS